MRPRLVGIAALLALGIGCSWSVQYSGPYRYGRSLVEARLARIAVDPSDEGTHEALDWWVADPEDAVARSAVLGAIPSAIQPVEARFGELDGTQQQVVFNAVGEVGGGEALSGVVVRLFPKVAPEARSAALTALAGRQDATAVQGLAAIGHGEHEPEIRALAFSALHPAETSAAREALLRAVANASDVELVRLAAVDALRPHDAADVRAALAPLAGAEDSAIAAAIFGALGTPRDAAEIEAGLAGTTHPKAAAAATTFLGRLDAWTPPVTARMRELAAATDPAVRWEAAIALRRHEDLAGAPPLVAFLDDEARRADARGYLDTWELRALEPLREHARGLTSAEARAIAVELLADLGGPNDRALLGELGADNAAVARLAHAPFGLFPDGVVRWGDAVTLKPYQAPLLEAVASVRHQAEGADPNLAYVALARAWAAGGRSDAGRQAAVDAAQAGLGTFSLLLEVRAVGRGDLAGTALAEAVPRALGASVQAPLRVGTPPAPHVARVTVGGALTCDAKTTTSSSAQPSEYERYAYHVPNPAKEQARQVMDSLPDDIRECYVNCYESGYFKYSEQRGGEGGICSGYTSGNLTCSPEVRVVKNPEWERARDVWQSIPPTLEQSWSREITRTGFVSRTPTTCQGELDVRFGDKAATFPVSYAGERVETWARRVAPAATLEDGTAIPALDDEADRKVTDERLDELRSIVASSLGGFRVPEAEVRANYGASVAPAIAAGDARSARDALLWSRPELYDLDGAAFREVWLAGGEGAFPTEWTGSRPH